jgi:hypothetical protein
MMRAAILSSLILATGAAAGPSHLLFAGGSWASFDRGQSCEAVAQPLMPARKQDSAPFAAIAFDRAGPRHGQFSAQLRRPVRPGSSVMLTIGDQPFLLVANGASAWSKESTQEAAIISAMRLGSGMRIEARDAGGRRLSDRYLLDGAPTAIDAAAAACSLPR